MAVTSGQQDGVAPATSSARAAVVVGLMAVCVTLGAGLGIAVTSGSPLGVLDPDPTAPAAPVTGKAGLTPAAPPIRLPLAGDFAPGPVAVTPDPSLLPSTCPATSWQLDLATPGLPGTVEVLVALAASAPQSCQGFSGHLPVLASLADSTGAGLADSTGPGAASVTARTAAPVTVGVLAAPGLTLQQRGGRVVVTPLPASTGPQPTTYTVEWRQVGGDWTAVCATPSGAQCVAPAKASGRSAEFRVVASIGAWRRGSSPVNAADLTLSD